MTDRAARAGGEGTMTEHREGSEMRKAVVTGGGGFIGKALVQALVARGIAVTVVGRSRYPDLDALDVRCLQGDIRDQRFLDQAFADCDTVFHAAAKAGVWGPRHEYFSINLEGTGNVIAACRKNSVPRLVYTSTPSVVFAQHDLEGADESAPYAINPLCHYAASKILAEQEILRANDRGLQTVAIRPHLVWGPGDHHLVPRLLTRGRERALKIVGTGRNRVDITYIDNVVHAHLLAADNLAASSTAAGHAFFIGQAEPVVLWSWINELFARLEIPVVRKTVPFPVALTVGAVMEGVYAALGRTDEPRMTRFVAYQLAKSHWFGHLKAEQLLGYRPVVSTESGLDRLVAWLKDASISIGHDR